jgi:hypothetical protein
VPVPPAVGEPLSEPGAGHLPTELGLESTAGFVGAAGHRLLKLAQLRLRVGLERAGESGDQSHSGLSVLST